MRNYLISLIIIGISCIAVAEETWSVAQAFIEGKPVVYKFMNELPNKPVRDTMSWLTVISWKYDGSNNNGMPLNAINESMIKLEDGLENIEGRETLYFDDYSATGNNLKEFVFYIADRELFMANFNKALNGHPSYPIAVNFYEDKEWSDFTKLKSDFAKSANK